MMLDKRDLEYFDRKFGEVHMRITENQEKDIREMAELRDAIINVTSIAEKKLEERMQAHIQKSHNLKALVLYISGVAASISGLGLLIFQIVKYIFRRDS